MDLPSQTGRAPSSSLEPGASKAQSHLWCQGWSRQPPWRKGERGGAGPPADLSDMLCLFSSIQSIPLRARGRVRPPLAFARVWEGLGTMPAAWRNAGGRSSRLARLEWTQTPPTGAQDEQGSWPLSAPVRTPEDHASHLGHRTQLLKATRRVTSGHIYVLRATFVFFLYFH